MQCAFNCPYLLWTIDIKLSSKQAFQNLLLSQVLLCWFTAKILHKNATLEYYLKINEIFVYSSLIKIKPLHYECSQFISHN